MNIYLALSPAAPQLRVNFTFDWPGGILMELRLEGTVAGEGLGDDLTDIYRMIDNLRYSQSGFTTCAECDRHQILAILRRSIQRARMSPALATITLSIKDENGKTTSIAVTDKANESMFELENVLRSVAGAHPGHAHGGSAKPAHTATDLSVH